MGQLELNNFWRLFRSSYKRQRDLLSCSLLGMAQGNTMRSRGKSDLFYNLDIVTDIINRLAYRDMKWKIPSTFKS